MAENSQLGLNTLRDIRNRAQALVSEQRHQLERTDFLEGTAAAVAEVEDDGTPADPNLLSALNAECDDLEAQLRDVQQQLARRHQQQQTEPPIPPKRLIRISVLEAKKRMFLAELAEMTRRKTPYNPDVQKNPEFIKANVRQETEASIAQLEQTNAAEEQKLKDEKLGLERDKIALQEQQSLSRALDVRMKAFDKRGAKLKEIKSINHRKELERRLRLIGQDSGYITQELIAFLDKHFKMTEEEMNKFNSIIHGRGRKSSSSASKSGTTKEKEKRGGGHDDGDEGGSDGEDADASNRRGRKRRRGGAESSAAAPADANEDYHNSSDEAPKTVLNMKLMLQELLNKYVRSPNEAYVDWVSQHWFEYYVEFLVSSGVAEKHPQNDKLVKLADLL